MFRNVYLLFIFFCVSFVAHSSSYIINVSESLENSNYRAQVENYLSLAYAKLGITPEFKYYPSSRGIKMVNEGQLDADAGRSEFVSKQYSNLIKVDEPLVKLPMAMFCLDKSQCQIQADAFYGSLSGFKSHEIICENNKMSCLSVNNNFQLAKLLEKGRVSAVLLPHVLVPDVMCRLSKEEVYYQPIFDEGINSYHYLSPENAALAKKLEVALKQVKTGIVTSRIGSDWLEVVAGCGINLKKLAS